MAFYTAAQGNALRMDFEIYRVGNPATVVTRTSEALVFEIDGYRYAFSGSGLAYDAAGHPTAGSLNGFQYSKDGAILFEKPANASWFLSPDYFARPEWLNDPAFVQTLVPGNDYIYGGDKDDWISDGRGNNFLRGGGGNDTIVAGGGADHIYGFSPEGGADGADYVEGGGGGDYIQGNAGNDRLYGGAGSDRLNGGADNDHLAGDAGNDSINGNRGDDGIGGGEGNDRLRGGQGNDSINGGDGDDLISGDLGADFMTGDQGRDIFLFGEGQSPLGDSTDRIFDFEDGADKLSFGFTPTAFLSPVPFGDPLPNGDFIELAQSLVDQTPGGGEIVVIQLSNYVRLYWSSHGDGRIDSVLFLDAVPGASVGFDDFI